MKLLPRAGWAVVALFACPGARTSLPAAEFPAVAPKPLYRDPLFDGAADPVVVWNPHVQRWWMFYTNRRATAPGLSGVAWVHGTRIGIAESADQGVTWSYLGTANIDLPAEVGGREPTHWAPEVVTDRGGGHHLFLTVVPGVFENWEHPRKIVHLTSTDLRTWTYVSTLPLSTDRAIDACVSELPGGGWRMWYNNERDAKSIYAAESRDLKRWVDRGKVASIQARGEGPAVFTWRGRHWMLVDTWRGLAVYRSRDFSEWALQPGLLLDRPGQGSDDGVVGGHPGVVVSGTRAFCFYFTHPGRSTPGGNRDHPEWRRSSIQVVELFEQDGWLKCDRDAPTQIALLSPEQRRSSAREIAATERDPAEAAKLMARGSRDIRAHDPSTLAYSNGEYWLFHTGRGVPTWRSRDLRTWTEGPPVFAESPPWVADAVPENRNTHFWAPDIIKGAERYLLYYSVSAFGQRTSAIALATNAVLDPADPRFGWRDEGPIIRSGSADDFNAIDPALFRDGDGRFWMVFGSYWSGIKLLELDPATGKRISPDSPLHALAHDRSIEAAFIHRRGQHYFLFVNKDWCCRGVNSPYYITVGRADRITGPYLDRAGRPMLRGGGTVFLETESPVIGPGHASVQLIDGREWFGYHFYDATQNGRATYALRPLTWDSEGWPVGAKVDAQN